MNDSDDSLAEVIAVLTGVLQLAEQTTLAADTPLLGGIPEFDSLAVASVVIGLEEHFGLEFDDEDITAGLFETVGTLARFVDRNRPAGVVGKSAPEAYFLSTTSGSLFVIRHDTVENPQSRCVVFVAPFAEEMNRVRTLITATAQSLNLARMSCCYFDFHGTGDSEGEFADARWSQWLMDLQDIVSDLRSQGFQTIDLIGIRLGALLAVDYVKAFDDDIARIVFWDPVFDGQSFIDRFLRTRTMAAMMSGETESLKELHSRLEAGESVEVGGYHLHPELAAGIAGFVPAEGPVLTDTSLYWISRDDSANATAVAAGLGLQLARVVTPDYEPYWQRAGTTTAPELVAATRECLTVAVA